MLLGGLVACGSSSDAGNALLNEATKTREVLQSLLTIDPDHQRWKSIQPGAERCAIPLDKDALASVTQSASAVKSRIGDVDRLIANGAQALSTASRLDGARKELARSQAPLLVFVQRTMQAPHVVGKTFEPGVLEGMVVLYDVTANRAACAAHVRVTNSSSVEFGLTPEEARAMVEKRLALTDLRPKSQLEKALLQDLLLQVDRVKDVELKAIP